jgi:hypothetical protein
MSETTERQVLSGRVPKDVAEAVHRFAKRRDSTASRLVARWIQEGLIRDLEEHEQRAA